MPTVAPPLLATAPLRYDRSNEEAVRHELRSFGTALCTALRWREVFLESATFAIDATGLHTLTMPHGLRGAPVAGAVQVVVLEDTAVDDWAYDLLKVAVDATNVVVKIHVSSASATGGAVARVGARVYRQE